MLLRQLYKTKIFWKYTNEFTSNCLGLAHKKDYEIGKSKYYKVLINTLVTVLNIILTNRELLCRINDAKRGNCTVACLEDL